MRRRAAVALLLACAACGAEPGSETGSDEAVVVTQAPPGTDIWLATLTHTSDGTLGITDATNVTERPGYDNQPTFLPDGSAFYYTVIDDVGQADIWRYDLLNGLARPVTSTSPESEYSGTPMPDGGFSAVRVEADSTQRLWRFDADGGNEQVLFPGIAPVGYHAWSEPGTAALYVLGDPPILQIAHVNGAEATRAAEDVGRSLQPIPGGRDVSYVQRLADGATEIRRLDMATGRSTPIVAGMEGGDFHAWTPDGVLLQAHEGSVYAWHAGDTEWTRIADLSSLGIRLSRIAVSPDGTRIALVGEAGS